MSGVSKVFHFCFIFVAGGDAFALVGDDTGVSAGVTGDFFHDACEYLFSLPVRVWERVENLYGCGLLLVSVEEVVFRASDVVCSENAAVAGWFRDEVVVVCFDDFYFERGLFVGG